MAEFLRLISVVYLIAVWTIFAIAVSDPPIGNAAVEDISAEIMSFAAIALSLPAFALVFYAQRISDILGAGRERIDQEQRTGS
jgi:hypothetical protein